MPMKKLWPQNEIIVEEADIPLVPRFFWRSSRRRYEADDSVSAILMMGLAVESGVNEYASAWLHRKFEKNMTEAMQFLEASMDFRKTVELMWYTGAFKKELKDDLHTVYDRRNKYAHIQTLKILGELGEYETEETTPDGKTVRKIKAKDDEVYRILLVNVKAEDDAFELLKKTELCMVRLFKMNESDYWKQLIWNRH